MQKKDYNTKKQKQMNHRNTPRKIDKKNFKEKNRHSCFKMKRKT